MDAEIVADSKSPPELSPIIGGLGIAPEITSAKRTRLEGFALLVESTRLDRDFFLLCDLVDKLGACSSSSSSSVTVKVEVKERVQQTLERLATI